MEGRQTKTGVKVVFTNAQSINNKIDEMRALVAINKPDILAITETWTNDSIGDSILEIDGFGYFCVASKKLGSLKHSKLNSQHLQGAYFSPVKSNLIQEES